MVETGLDFKASAHWALRAHCANANSHGGVGGVSHWKVKVIMPGIYIYRGLEIIEHFPTQSKKKRRKSFVSVITFTLKGYILKET